MVGLYFHIPFCNGKCPYCSFYSVCDRSKTDIYRQALEKSVLSFCENNTVTADTLYFGGGTPTLLGEGLCSIVNLCKKKFGIDENSEVTCETNPTKSDVELYKALARSGVNRLSMGLQSANENELRLLGRKHTKEDVLTAVSRARAAGIDNISVDIMLATPGQTLQSLNSTVDFVLSLDVDHISAYMLKIEKGTPFYTTQKEMPEEICSEMYLKLSERLCAEGYEHYEISNFARNKKYGKHNLKYWNDEEYLGFGAAAHSFFNGKRFYYPADIDSFISGNSPVDDGEGGDFEEYIMLKLRLKWGVCEQEVYARFGHGLPEHFKSEALKLQKSGLVTIDKDRIGLTTKGFLLSNSVIASLLY